MLSILAFIFRTFPLNTLFAGYADASCFEVLPVFESVTHLTLQPFCLIGVSTIERRVAVPLVASHCVWVWCWFVLFGHWWTITIGLARSCLLNGQTADIVAWSNTTRALAEPGQPYKVGARAGGVSSFATTPGSRLALYKVFVLGAVLSIQQRALRVLLRVCVGFR